MTLKNIKNILLPLIFILLSNNLFSNGNGEIKGYKVDDPNREISLNSFTQLYDKGSIKFVTTSKGGRVYTHIVTLKDGIPYNSIGEQIDLSEWHGFIDEVTYNGASKILDQIHERDLILRKAEIKYLEKEKLREARVKPDEQFVTIPTGVNDTEYTFFGIDAVNNKLESFTITITPNFFLGESKFYKDFFNNSGNKLSVTQKRILFMSTFFCNEGELKSNSESIEFMNMIKKDSEFFLHNSKPGELSSSLNFDLKIEDYINSDSISSINNLRLHQELFKRAFISHFNINIDKFFNPDPVLFKKEYEAPYLDINSESFKALYGIGPVESKYRSDFLFSYLTYLKNKDKPVLSYLIKSNKDFKSYDYRDYREISIDEGENIVKAALKYMTWGVEYTPLVSSKLDNNLSNTEVFKNNKLLLQDWVYSNKNSVNNKKTNYLNPDYEKVLTNSLNIPNNSDFKKLYEDGYITTPYLSSDGKAISGNPIAYSPLGTDTPRSFNYKLIEQHKAKLWMVRNSNLYFKQLDINTTLGRCRYTGGDLKENGYITELDLYRDFIDKNGLSINLEINSSNLEYNQQLPNLNGSHFNLKPYITYHPMMESRYNLDFMYSNNSMFNVNKIAGVDSMGLLSGSLAIALEGKTTLLNILYQNVIKNVDTYNYNLNPLFHHSNNSDHYRMRLNKSDIEASSILIPDLSQARKGDILVNFTKDYPHIGIIVEADFSDIQERHTTKDYMKRIKILSTKNGFRMANIGSWHIEGNTFSGFAKKDEEKNYHIRRLLVKDYSDVPNTSDYVKDKLELFDVNYLGLNVSLDIDENYIPNTGELLEINSINITADILGDGNNDPENAIPLDTKNNEIMILPPLDMYRIPKSNKESNIFNNKGAGLKFYAIDDVEGAICLATFELDKDLDEFDKSPYKVTYNTDIFIANGRSRNPNVYKLYVNNNNKLVFEYKSGKKHKIIRKFGVRPIYAYDINAGNPAFPYKIIDGKKVYGVGNQVEFGDDFLLRFGLVKNPSVQGVVPDKDSLEIYNKKLLWMCNLFSDRRSGQNNDWNLDYPWNAPPKINLKDNFGIGPDNAHYENLKFITLKQFGMKPDERELIWYGENRWNFEMGSDYSKYKKVLKYALHELEYYDLNGIEPGNGRQNLSIKYDPDNPNPTISYQPGVGWQDEDGVYTDKNILLNGIGYVNYDKPIINYNNRDTEYHRNEKLHSMLSSTDYLKKIIRKVFVDFETDISTDLNEVFNQNITDFLAFMNNECPAEIRENLKKAYYSGLNRNYNMWDVNGDTIYNILPYILKDTNNNKPYTRRGGREAILNSEADYGYHVFRNGWRVEAQDTFHENGYPSVKMLHVDGGEQIYNMKTGQLIIDDPIYGCTFNVDPGPYNGPFGDIINGTFKYHRHALYDVVTWIMWGGGANDTTSEEDRFLRLKKGQVDPYGDEYVWPDSKDIETSGLTDDEIIRKGGIIPKLREEPNHKKR